MTAFSLACTWGPPLVCCRRTPARQTAMTTTTMPPTTTARRSSACTSNSWPPMSPGNAPGTLQVGWREINCKGTLWKRPYDARGSNAGPCISLPREILYDKIVTVDTDLSIRVYSYNHVIKNLPWSWDTWSGIWTSGVITSYRVIHLLWDLGGLILISVFHHLAQLHSRFCQILISPSRST